MTSFTPMPAGRSRLVRLLFVAFFAASQVPWGAVTAPAAAATPAEELGNAFQLWQNAMFEEALGVLDGLVKREGLAKEVRRDAYLLMGQCRLAVAPNDRKQASAAFCQAVKADPGWDLKSGSVDLADAELKLYAQAREECKPKGLPTLLIAGAAAVGVGSLVLLFAGGGGDSGTEPDNLPDFPPTPSGD